jgi:hypothetical protein
MNGGSKQLIVIFPLQKYDAILTSDVMTLTT